MTEVDVISHPHNQERLQKNRSVTETPPSLTVKDQKRSSITFYHWNKLKRSLLGHLSKVVTADGRTYFLNKRLKDLKWLEHELFFRINNAVILNLAQVHGFCSWYVCSLRSRDSLAKQLYCQSTLRKIYKGEISMINEMKNQFMQTSFVSIVWLTLILSLTNQSVTIPFGYVWHIIAIGTLAGFVFGVLYLYYGIILPFLHLSIFSSPP
ncbi:hypothetical protein ACEQPO_03925 [Bacillus sp. SL00103]